MVVDMRLTAKGRDLLFAREGFKTTAYRDTKGIPTICVGHTSMAGPPKVVMGMVVKRAECEEMFERDVRQYEKAVNDGILVDLADHEFDALVSFCYNVGTGGCKKSTAFRLINKGDKKAGAKALMNWVTPPEITGRRNSERLQFLTPYPGSITANVTAPAAVIAAGAAATYGLWDSLTANPMIFSSMGVMAAVMAAVIGRNVWQRRKDAKALQAAEAEPLVKSEQRHLV